ncbi:hypothetical protein F5Y16DRAFT_338545 [Xylariaceae sp. FL0255]|nr:hypothetical protein F5Y16DRAFT_338545 [Xylariaceae sp. FL0255]
MVWFLINFFVLLVMGVVLTCEDALGWMCLTSGSHSVVRDNLLWAPKKRNSQIFRQKFILMNSGSNSYSPNDWVYGENPGIPRFRTQISRLGPRCGVRFRGEEFGHDPVEPVCLFVPGLYRTEYRPRRIPEGACYRQIAQWNVPQILQAGSSTRISISLTT